MFPKGVKMQALLAFMAFVAFLRPSTGLKQHHRYIETSPQSFVVDLTHALDEDAPVLKDHAPLERITEYRDDGMGAR